MPELRPGLRQGPRLYPEANEDRCTACLLLDIDPVGLVRGRDRRQSRVDGTLAQYVNDRPYVASSFVNVAIAQLLGSALRGAARELHECVFGVLALESEPVDPRL